MIAVLILLGLFIFFTLGSVYTKLDRIGDECARGVTALAAIAASLERLARKEEPPAPEKKPPIPYTMLDLE